MLEIILKMNKYDLFDENPSLFSSASFCFSATGCIVISELTVESERNQRFLFFIFTKVYMLYFFTVLYFVVFVVLFTVLTFHCFCV